MVVKVTLLRVDPAHPGGMAAVAASEKKVACYISKLDTDSRVAIAVSSLLPSRNRLNS